MKCIEWTNEDIEFLKNNYKTQEIKFCCEKLNRSHRAIAQMAHRLNLRRKVGIVSKEGYRFCYSCKEEKLSEEFNKGMHNWCRICAKKYAVEYRIENPFRNWATKTIRDHINRNCSLSFTIDQLEQIGKNTKFCPLCKQEIHWNNNKIEKNSPSLDRLDNNFELNLNNILVICHDCNACKRSKGLEEYINYIEKILPELKEILKKKNNVSC